LIDFLALGIPIIQTKELETAYKKIKRRSIQSVWQKYGIEDFEKSGKFERINLDGHQFCSKIYFDSSK